MIETFLEEELSSLKSDHLYRELKVLDNYSVTSAQWQGRKVTLFCGNDYLGLSRHPKLIQALKQYADQEGLGSGASRLISGTSRAHENLETKLAAFKNKEAALVFSSGYMANVGTLSTLAGKNDLIVMDKLCHASLIDGAKLSQAEVRVFPHKNYRRLKEILSHAKGFKTIWIVSETVFSMDGDLADFAQLTAIKKEFGAGLFLDDAHGTGVLGLDGSGPLAGTDYLKDVDVLSGTLSKSLGCIGGFAAASFKVKEYLINRARPFIFATALPSILCRVLTEAVEVVQSEPEHREKLWKKIKYVYQALTQAGMELPELTSPILPVMMGAEERALKFSSELLKQGVFVPAIRTPTVARGKARLRVTLSALHTDEEIEKLVEAFKKVG